MNLSEMQPQLKSIPSAKIEQSCLCVNVQCATLNSRHAEQCRHCGHPLQIQNRYRVTREIGQGQFAKTYEAIDQHLQDKTSIIKQFSPKLDTFSHQQLALARGLFKQEALILQRLGEHPQIPNLLGYVEENSTPFLVQEFIPGRSLYHCVKQTPNSFEIEIEALLLNLLPVLDFVHSHNIVHRDIKLGNIIHAPSGQLWLIDFGSAFHQNFGRYGISGTPGYAAPEQLAGKASPVSDLYSLAVTCISLISGNLLEAARPHVETPDEFLKCLQQEAQTKLTPKLAKILEQMLQPKADDRYPSAQAVLEALRSPTPQITAKNSPTIDYTHLQALLADEAYREADLETWHIVLKLSNAENKLTIDSIENLPITDLQILDQLWSTASHGKFGFSAQFRVYQRQFEDLHHLNYGQWQAFAETIGWYQVGEWLGYNNLSFEAASPPTGHLPAIFASLENRQGYSTGPLNWWRLGFISFMERLFLR